ncbi:hypothetical protein BS47DRAFT_1335996 [Hydnum rufescens UP504]|uniref:Uncharacterized protein n=1 Tax=Hydnum rufescens UP504 TaxID=1448309 RepID=A0A9P6BBD6_9AGAM|nr:hypothetical protein BS47DRAFT_1335996 [Hydnum rufescens UP504]
MDPAKTPANIIDSHGGSAFHIPAPAESLASHILTPGSTLNPQFLLVLDGAFGMLLGIFLVLLVLTWSIHFIALICIELGLWASVKLYVSELRKDNEEKAKLLQNGDIRPKDE